MTRTLDDLLTPEGAGLAVDVGTRITFQAGQLPRRVESFVVGARPGQYMVITAPQGTGPVADAVRAENTPLVIRYIHRGNVYGFKSSVIHHQYAPEPLLFIAFPARVEVFHLREYPRVDCLLPARAIVGESVFEGTVNDISRTGGRLVLGSGVRAPGLEGHIREPVVLEVRFPGVEGFTRLPGDLRNVTRSRDELRLGVAFGDIAGGPLVALLAFLLDAHALPEHQGVAALLRRHHRWRERIADFLRDGDAGDGDLALGSGECALGQWLAGEGRRRYGDCPEFEELERRHRAIHEAVADLVERARKGDAQEARKAFETLDLAHLSHELAALLMAADEHQAGSPVSGNR